MILKFVGEWNGAAEGHEPCQRSCCCVIGIDCSMSDVDLEQKRELFFTKIKAEILLN